VFVVEVVKGGFAPISSNINIGPPTGTLVEMGAKVAFLMRYNNEGWRFVSTLFVHAGILHILLNLIAQIRYIGRIK
jgi:membrane associated rhomboid family serine protease